METIAYHPSNFERVKKLVRKTQNAFKHGAEGRILFNSTRQTFEFYESSELNKINIHDTYTHVETAIQDYKDNNKKEVNMSETNTDFSLAFPVEEGEYDIQDNAEKTLEVITKISKQTTQENREKMLAVIAEIFKLDVVSESDVLKTILEHEEYRKLLSIMLGRLGVEIAYTRSNMELQVDTVRLKFAEQAVYNFDDYKKGVIQARSVIEAFKAMEFALKEKTAEVESRDKIIRASQTKIEELRGQLSNTENETKSSREIKPVVPVYFNVMFDDGKGVKFITVTKGAKANEDGSFPTKYLDKTVIPSKAKRFTNSEAAAQIAKIIKFSKNITFTDLSEKGPKELLTIFSVVRVLIEKPEAAE